MFTDRMAGVKPAIHFSDTRLLPAACAYIIGQRKSPVSHSKDHFKFVRNSRTISLITRAALLLVSLTSANAAIANPPAQSAQMYKC